MKEQENKLGVLEQYRRGNEAEVLAQLTAMAQSVISSEWGRAGFTRTRTEDREDALSELIVVGVLSLQEFDATRNVPFSAYCFRRMTDRLKKLNAKASLGTRLRKSLKRHQEGDSSNISAKGHRYLSAISGYLARYSYLGTDIIELSEEDSIDMVEWKIVISSLPYGDAFLDMLDGHSIEEIGEKRGLGVGEIKKGFGKVRESLRNTLQHS